MASTQTVRLEPIQSRAFRALSQPHQTVCIPWGRGGGKSWFQRFWWYTQIAQWDGKLRPGAKHPGVRIVLLMPTLEQAKKVHASLMISELEGDGDWAWLKGQINKSEWKVSFPGGSSIQWVTAERAKHIRGIRCDIISVDECDDVDSQVVDAIVKPWFTEVHSLRQMLLSGTPTRGRYGLLYRTHMRGIGKLRKRGGAPFANYSSFHATSYDFPSHVSREYIEEIREDIDEKLFKREWMCDFDAAEGLVYDIFEEGFHVRRPHPAMVWSDIIVGCDLGFTNPGAFVVLGISGSGDDAKFHVIHEVYQSKRDDSWWINEARKIRQVYPTARWFHDPSAPARIEALRGLDIQVFEANNDVDEGVLCVGDKLGIRHHEDDHGNVTKWARLYIDPSCVNTIAEFGKYRRKRDPRNPEVLLEAVDKKNDHAMDAVRYAIFTHMGAPRWRVIEHDPYGPNEP